MCGGSTQAAQHTCLPAQHTCLPAQHTCLPACLPCVWPAGAGGRGVGAQRRPRAHLRGAARGRPAELRHARECRPPATPGPLLCPACRSSCPAALLLALVPSETTVVPPALVRPGLSRCARAVCASAGGHGGAATEHAPRVAAHLFQDHQVHRVFPGHRGGLRRGALPRGAVGMPALLRVAWGPVVREGWGVLWRRGVGRCGGRDGAPARCKRHWVHGAPGKGGGGGGGRAMVRRASSVCHRAHESWEATAPSGCRCGVLLRRSTRPSTAS